MPSRIRSANAFSEAKRFIPGGVNSPVRAFQAVGGDPVYFRSGDGARVCDLDGNRYIDYVGSWGCMILGHSAYQVREAIEGQVQNAIGFGAPTLAETRLARKLVSKIPGMQSVRLVSSGTEATMSALRLARGFTGRDLIVKFKGCYHGHVDALLVGAGSGVLTLGIPGSPGVPQGVVNDTLNLEYNDIESAERAFDVHGKKIAAVILEPIAGNMGCIPAHPAFVGRLRELTKDHAALLIFDEVISGFRVAAGGAASVYGVEPDITTLGKIIGGGLPIGAFGGRKDIMDVIAPQGPVYQAGTLSGNPIAASAGLAVLEALEAEGFYQDLEARTHQLADGLLRCAAEAEVAVEVNRACGMIGLFFTDKGSVHNYSDVTACDAESYSQFFHGMLERGVYMAPSAFETMFVSAAHGESEIDATLDEAEKSFRGIAKQ